MAKPGTSSFRRILLSRILLLSVPVILIGEAVTFKKARSSLLETAHQNLIESAVRKQESIDEAIKALKASLLLASQTTALQSGSPKETQRFLNQLKPQLPTHIQCIQLKTQTGNIVASTCSNQTISPATKDSWPVDQRPQDVNPIHIQAVLPQSTTKVLKRGAGLTDPHGQLQLILSAPVYSHTGQLRYTLNILSALHEQEMDKRGSLAGSTAVIAQNGTILAYPLADRVGDSIEQEFDAAQIKRIFKEALSGRQSFLHLSAKKTGVELLVGYTAIPSPLTTEQNQSWIILAVTQIDNALYGLQEIKLILFTFTVGLLAASVLATLYISHDLALPLEKLRDYALNVQSRQRAFLPAPHNFKIRELNQLATALDQMVERLKAWAQEIERAWEETQAANRLKSEFLATTSHELRTPLNAIIGCVRLVRDGCCDDRDEEMEFLLRADEAAIHLLGIINDLLDISRIEAGKLFIVFEPLDLRQALKEVINLQTVHIEQKGLQLNCPDWQEPIPIQADPAKLKQVLINVIGNAVKFTEEGSITIATHIESASDPADSTPRVVVTVQDTGVGIDPAQQHKLFRPFVMVDGTTTRKFGGTGLGLAISRNLVELMGGTIMLWSAGHNQGTKVAISLPLTDVSLLRLRSVSVEESLVPDSSHMARVTADESV